MSEQGLPPLDVLAFEYAQAKTLTTDPIAVRFAAERLCRERQLSNALAKLSKLESQPSPAAETCIRCNGTGRRPPWEGSNGLVDCDHSAAPAAVESGKDVDWEQILVCAVRYAQGRMTYIVNDACRWVKALWPSLSENTKTVIKSDLKSFLRTGRLGMDIDAKEWQELQAWISEFRALPVPQAVESAAPAEGVREITIWRDPGTAPKDGTEFIGQFGRLVFLTRWQKYYDKWPHQEGGPTYRGGWSYEDADSHTPCSRLTGWIPMVLSQPQSAPKPKQGETHGY